MPLTLPQFKILFIGLCFLVGCQAQTTTPSPNTNQNPPASGATALIEPTRTPIPDPTSTEDDLVSPEPEAATGANADVTFVKAVKAADGSWTFHVTVSHPDTGWEDYADGWDVVLPDGVVVKSNPSDTFTRLLLHPHETEQPFTRSQGGLLIPEGITQVTVRAHDLVDGFGGQVVIVDLSAPSGEKFEVVQ